jgi:hypothetical protein
VTVLGCPGHSYLCPDVVAFAARRRPLHDLTHFAALDQPALLRELIRAGHYDIALQYGATRQQIAAARAPRQDTLNLGDPTP